MSDSKDGSELLTTFQHQEIIQSALEHKKFIENNYKSYENEVNLLVTPVTLEKMYKNSLKATDAELLLHNSQLQDQLGKVTELLNEKSHLCTNMEMQNDALVMQTMSLKDALNITKQLLDTRTSEVVELRVHMTRMEERITAESESCIAIVDQMNECAKDTVAEEKEGSIPPKPLLSVATTQTTSKTTHQEVTERELLLPNTLEEELARTTYLLDEKIRLCSNLEKQIDALNSQANSLKVALAITKDLLNVRTSEVVSMCLHIKKIDEKLHAENDKYSSCYNQMKEAIRVNEDLKSQYETQMNLFEELCLKYEEKINILEDDNNRLSELAIDESKEGVSPLSVKKDKLTENIRVETEV